MKVEKIEFHVTSVTFLGFIGRQGQLLPDPAKVQVVAGWPTPNSRMQLQQFLGFTNFYRRFSRDYSKVAEPLTKLTSIAWSEEAETTFSGLKTWLKTPVLCHPDPSRQFVVKDEG